MTIEGRTTEALHSRSTALDTMSAMEIVTLMNEEDAFVPAAIEPALPAIAAFVEDAAQC